jgi:hypothetical protein
MWFFLNSLVPNFFKIRDNYTLKAPKVKYGFTARTDFEYKDELSTIKGVRPGHFTGNEVSLFGVFTGVMTLDVPIFDGIAKDFIDTNGCLDPQLLTDKAHKHVIDRKRAPMFTTIIHDAATLSSSVSLLYNLLRMYYLAKDSKMRYKPKDNFYDNGHVRIVNSQFFTEFLTELDMAHAVLFDKADVSIDKAPLDIGNFDDPAYLWTGRITTGEKTIIEKAAGKWTQKAPFSIGHSSPKLTSTVVIVPSGSADEVESNVQDKLKILNVINNLVATNRLYTDFAYAYLMLAQVYVTPTPRSAEASAWLVGEQIVNMPSLGSIKGYLPMMADSIPFARRADWDECFVNWRKEEGAILFHSIALVEAAYIELANVIKINGLDVINSENFVETSVDGSPISFGGIVQDLSLVSTRYGCSVDIPYALSCGLSRANGINVFTQIKVPVTISDAEAHNFYNLEVTPAVVEMENVLVVTQITAAMYPVMTYGINEDAYYANGLSDEITATARETTKGNIVFDNILDFSKFMNIFRMMGYDVTAQEALSRRNITNWADNASGRFLYTDTNIDEHVQIYCIDKDSITERPNSWIKIGQKHGSMTLKYSMSNLRMRMFCSNTELQLSGKLIMSTRQADNKAKMVTRTVTNKEGIKFIPLVKAKETDFRLVRYSIAPQVRPQPTLPSETVQVESGEDIPDDETPGAIPGM